VNPTEFAEELAGLAEFHAGLARGKAVWLENFSDGRNKRPDWEIHVKRDQLAKLERTREVLIWMAGKAREKAAG
jgi:hypothetical protein